QVRRRNLLLTVVAVLAASLFSARPETKALGEPFILIDAKSGTSAALWLESSLHRVYPKSSAGGTNLSLFAARNSKISFQACVQNRSVHPLKVQCSISGADGLKAQVRTVGLVPMPHLTPNTDASELEG